MLRAGPPSGAVYAMKGTRQRAGAGAVRQMPFAVRPLGVDDVAQAAEIERDAFPETFPPTSFTRELGNRVARYLVAWRREEVESDEAPNPYVEAEEEYDAGQGGVRRFIRNARGLLPWRTTAWEPGQQYLTGFLGTWQVLDEAHIVSVGVRTVYRGMGVGELLLIAAIEQALEHKADRLTLEVRVSNYVAQNLYAKYGFTKRGLRKGYYADNREDALIMTTGSIRVPSYEEDFRRLVAEHELRWGRACRDW